MGCCGTLATMLQAEQSIVPTSNSGVNAVWREKVVQWCYDVADHLEEDRRIVYVAMHILDRFVTPEMDEKQYELASLTCIFLAVRIAGHSDLKLEELVTMSRSDISVKEIMKIGTQIIEDFNWDQKIMPPIDFLDKLTRLLPFDSSRKQAIFESTNYLLEVSVCDVSLISAKASSLAAAALLVVLQNTLHIKNLQSYSDTLLKHVPIEEAEVAKLCRRLNCLPLEDNSSGPHLIEDDEADIDVVETTTMPSLKRSGCDIVPQDEPKRVRLDY